MRKLLFAAVGAVGDAYWRKEVVAAALGSALLGVAPFRIRHDKTSYLQAASTRLRKPNLFVAKTCVALGFASDGDSG
jgi:hypothetical protein